MKRAGMSVRPLARAAARREKGQEGFTLIEALIAIVVLMIGLVAVTNLMIVAGASNTTGSHTTAAANIASETLERLRAVPFSTLTTSTSSDPLSADEGTTDCDEADGTTTTNCVRPGNFNMLRTVAGVGRIKTRWSISQIDGQLIFIRVRSESLTPLIRQRSRAEFTTFRSCTRPTSGCPAP